MTSTGGAALKCEDFSCFAVSLSYTPPPPCTAPLTLHCLTLLGGIKRIRPEYINATESSFSPKKPNHITAILKKKKKEKKKKKKAGLGRGRPCGPRHTVSESHIPLLPFCLRPDGRAHNSDPRPRHRPIIISEQGDTLIALCSPLDWRCRK